MALKYEGCALFRQRISAATLSGKVLKITKIRQDDEYPGLQDFEASFLQLIDKITDGAVIEINETGTSLRYKPGILVGGFTSHDCALSRPIGWYLEGLLSLAPLCKKPLQLELTGITNDATDLSVDTIIAVTLPLLRNFGIEGATLQIKKRGASPKGGGHIEFYCPVMRELKPIYITDVGLVRRIRGTAFCTRISPTIITRVVDSARSVLNHVIPDVYIHTDHYKGVNGGLSPGYSLSLVAETTTGAIISAERAAIAGAGAGGELPETIGQEGALLLLEEISQGGVIDSAHQALVLQLMVVGPEDVSKIRVGELTDTTIMTLQLLRDAFGVVFKIKAGSESQVKDGISDSSSSKNMSSNSEDRSVLLSCLGIGFKNVFRRVT